MYFTLWWLTGLLLTLLTDYDLAPRITSILTLGVDSSLVNFPLPLRTLFDALILRNLFLPLLARTILFLLGWKLFPQHNINFLLKHPRLIFIFSHSSYWDYLIFIVYMWAHPSIRGRLKVLVKPQPFKYIGWFLRAHGAIPAVPLEYQSHNQPRSGGTARIITELSHFPKFAFMISPKGTMRLSEWHTSWYYLAHHFKGGILIGGLDYETGTPVTSLLITGMGEQCYRADEEGYLQLTNENYTKEFYDREALQEILQDSLSTMVPLHPTQEVKVRPHDTQKISWFHGMRFPVGLLITMMADIPWNIYVVPEILRRLSSVMNEEILMEGQAQGLAIHQGIILVSLVLLLGSWLKHLVSDYLPLNC